MNTSTSHPRRWPQVSAALALGLAWLIACTRQSVAHGPTALPTLPLAASSPLTEEQHQTLSSLTLVDPYPLYTLRYSGDYVEQAQTLPFPSVRVPPAPSWACSLFAALGDPQAQLYGRNFDWDYSPALLLFTSPSDGFASVSMIDIAYLFDDNDVTRTLADLPIESRLPLLDAPGLPFDGMNERGLTVGMAAVPDSELPSDPAKPTLDSLAVMRRILDHTRTVDEAVAMLRSVNLTWGSGPPLHYLLADASGGAALVEFYQGEMVVFPNQGPWHEATNFLLSASGESPEGICPRYDRIHEALTGSSGILSPDEAFQVLRDVSSPGPESGGTQWSVVYDMSTRALHVVMGRNYDQVYSFELGE